MGQLMVHHTNPVAPESLEALVLGEKDQVRDTLFALLKNHAPACIESKQDGDRSWFRLVIALASTATPKSWRTNDVSFARLASGRGGGE